MPERPITTAFLDRDGTINAKPAEGDYVKSWSEFSFLPGAVEGIRLLTDAGIRTIVVTNQRGIALGRMDEADLRDIHTRMRSALAEVGASLDAIYHCPHAEDACDCRKPGTGMFEQSCRDFPDIDLSHSVVIGDSWRDIQAATALGTRAIYVGGGEEPPGTDLVASSLREAAERLVDPALDPGGRWRR